MLHKIFNASRQKSADAKAIYFAPDLATLARILQAADQRDGKHALFGITFGQARQKDETSILPPHLTKLRQMALARATTLGLEATDLAHTDRLLADMVKTLGDTIGSIEMDLYSNSPGLSFLASESIDTCHRAIKAFIPALQACPAQAFTHAPALTGIANPHSDDEISHDRSWDVVDFMNFFSRSAIRDEFAALRSTLEGARDQLQHVALTHLAETDPASMAVINARIVRTPDDTRHPRDPFAR